MRATVLSFLCLATVIAYVQRLALSAPTKDIERDLGLGTAVMGIVMGAWYWGYAFCQLPAGWVADRLGSKPALILFSVTWSVLTGLTGLVTGFFGLVAVWMLMGCAQAGIFPCATKAIGAVFPHTRQAFASGMLACCMALGAAVAQRLTAHLLGPLTWQEILFVYAVPGLVWAYAFAMIVPRPEAPVAESEAQLRTDFAEGDRPAPPQPAIEAVAAKPQWSRLVTDLQMQLICGQQFLRAAAIAFFYTWFPRYLQETKGLSAQEAGGLAWWPPLAGMFGGLLGGLFSDWVLKRTGNARLARQGMACTAMVVCATSALGAFFVADPAAAVPSCASGVLRDGRRSEWVFRDNRVRRETGRHGLRHDEHERQHRGRVVPVVVGWLVAAPGTGTSPCSCSPLVRPRRGPVGDPESEGDSVRGAA